MHSMSDNDLIQMLSINSTGVTLYTSDMVKGKKWFTIPWAVQAVEGENDSTCPVPGHIGTNTLDDCGAVHTYVLKLNINTLWLSNSTL